MNCPNIRFKNEFGNDFSRWEKSCLGDRFKFSSGKGLSKNDVSESGKRLCLLYGELFSKSAVVSDDEFSLTNVYFKNEKLSDGGEVLIPNSDVTPTGLATASCILKKGVILGGGVNILTPNKTTDGIFVAYMLRRFPQKMLRIVTGTTVRHLHNSELAKLEYLFPCLEEQQKIASFFSTLDEKIQCTEKALNLTSKIFAYFLNRYIVDATQSNSCLFEEIASISSASRVHKKEWLNDGVPFFRSSDVVSKFKNQENSLGKAYISPELYKKLTKKSGELKKGDILVTGGGSVGIPYLIESDDPIYTKDADLLWIKPKSECINSKFLYYYIASKAFRSELNKISHQGTISHLTISQLKKFLIPTPAISEQKRIVNNLDLFSLKLNILRKKLVLLESLKKGFMQQMFV